MKLDDLPVEALLSIFEMLDTVEVVKTFGLVNKQLSHLVLSPDFWCSRVSGLPQVSMCLFVIGAIVRNMTAT